MDLNRLNLEEYLPTYSIQDSPKNLHVRDLFDISPTLTEAAGAIVDSLLFRLLLLLRQIVARASRVRALPDEPELVEQLHVVVVFGSLHTDIISRWSESFVPRYCVCTDPRFYLY
ncbi:uncharacterized protein LOC109715122 isoform X2 [Ananas comosus]|uniref:Uncharacterized protein LOC109715122 isoform X2 n=1 Tax=Ananas comosus TaxID=4615 RepID=A0A6P5FPW4_ANACO|nr:uncharacterized protein LOC109715122 isoform X2 [Ananas comosus]